MFHSRTWKLPPCQPDTAPCACSETVYHFYCFYFSLPFWHARVCSRAGTWVPQCLGDVRRQQWVPALVLHFACDRVSLFLLPHPPLCISQTSCSRTSGHSPVFFSHPPIGVSLFQMFIRRVILTQRLNVRTLLGCSSTVHKAVLPMLFVLDSVYLPWMLCLSFELPSVVLWYSKPITFWENPEEKAFCTTSLELTQHLGAPLSGRTFCTVV